MHLFIRITSYIVALLIFYLFAKQQYRKAQSGETGIKTSTKIATIIGWSLIAIAVIVFISFVLNDIYS